MGTLKESQESIEPVAFAFGITPNNSNNLERKTRALLIGGTQADVDMTLAGGQRVVLTLAPGVLHPLEVIKVWTTGTTATGIYGLY